MSCLSSIYYLGVFMRFRFALLLVLLGSAAMPAFAEEQPNDDTTDTIQPTPQNPEPTEIPYHDNLLGDVKGLRTDLSERGVEVLLEYKADMFAVRRGGIKRGNSYLDNLDLRFDIDNEKLFGLHNNKAVVHFTNNAGGKPNARQVGSVMGIDGIETTKNAALLYELWDDQSFLDNSLSVRAGISDVNNEFMITESSLFFLSPVMQMGQTFAQSGVNGPPTFPYSGLGARVKYLPNDVIYAQGAVFNAVAGDPDHNYGNLHFQFDGGVMMIAEAGFTPKVDGIDGKPTILALGGWVYSDKVNDLVTVDANGAPVRKRSYGVYGLSSWLFYHDKQERGMNVFFRPNMADGDTKQVRYAYELGLVATKWVPGRPEGEMAIGFAQAINGSKYRQSVIAGGNTSNHSESVVDAYYRDKIMPGLAVQPDFQYIMNPGSNPSVGNAAVFGVRFDINF